MSPAIRTATTSAYTAMIPAMTTGIRDCGQSISLLYRTTSSPHTFMIRSDLNVPTPAMPIPDFAVPYAAPMQPNIICIDCQVAGRVLKS